MTTIVPPDDVYTSSIDGQNGLFNTENSNSPYQWINTKDKLGVKPAPYYDIEGNAKNLELYQKYADVALGVAPGPAKSIPNPAIKADNDKLPLGKRTFISAGKKCMDDSNMTLQDQYYVIDGMAKSPHNPTTSLGIGYGDGLIGSAEGILAGIDSNNINKFFTKGENDNIILKTTKDPNNNLCKKVEIKTDEQGNTDSKYVSLAELETMKKNGLVKESTPKKKDTKDATEAATETTETFQSRHGILSHHGGPRSLHKNLVYGFGGGGNYGYWTFPDSYLTYDVIERPTIEMQNISILESDLDDFIRERKWKRDRAHLPKGHEVVTGFFLGSITVLGLYVVYRFLDGSGSSFSRIPRR